MNEPSNTTIELLQKLSQKISVTGVQRTKGKDTRKGYDTDGYGYQYIVDRLNETLGSEWNFVWKIIHHAEGSYTSGKPFHDITVEVSISLLDKLPRSCVGGHTATSYADALKGAITNGFKKAAAFWGVGRDAFAGTIDDDNEPLPDIPENKQVTKSNTVTIDTVIDAMNKETNLEKLDKMIARTLVLGFNAEQLKVIREVYDRNKAQIKSIENDELQFKIDELKIGGK
jgi:hypothetical protein